MPFHVTQTINCRPMTRADLPHILRIQAALYPADILENEDFFLNRQKLAPATCVVALRGAEVVAYLIAYPWTSAMPPALNQPLASLPADADTWFVHDCAVSQAAQGSGVAGLMLAASARAAGLAWGSLVSLAPAVAYWQKQGYTAVPPSAALSAKLAAYGAGAVYMRCPRPFQ